MEKGELPEGWEWSNLGRIGKIISGVSYKAEEAIYQPSEHFVPIIRANNINGNLNFDDLVFVPQERVAKEQYIKNQDIVIAMSSGSKSIVGKSAQVKGDFKGSFGAFCAVFRCNDNVDKKYVGYFFQTPHYRNLISHSSRGININNLRKESIRSINIPLPPLPVQRRIVEILEQVDALRHLRAQADAETQTLLQSVFYEMFGDPVRNEKGWEVRKIEDLCSVVTDGEHITPIRKSLGIYLLSARNIQNHKIDLSDVDFIDNEEYNRISQRIKPKRSDILLSCSGTIGRVAQIKTEEKYQLVRSVALLRPIEHLINPTYLEYSFDTHFLKNQIQKNVHQSSQGNLFQGKIKQLNVIVPPMNLQIRFARIIQKVEDLQANQKESNEVIMHLFDGLMTGLFKGVYFSKVS